MKDPEGGKCKRETSRKARDSTEVKHLEVLRKGKKVKLKWVARFVSSEHCRGEYLKVPQESLKRDELEVGTLKVASPTSEKRQKRS